MRFTLDVKIVLLSILSLSACTGSGGGGGSSKTPLPINAEGTLGRTPSGYLISPEKIKAFYTNAQVAISGPAGTVLAGALPLSEVRILVLATTNASLTALKATKPGTLVTIEGAEQIGTIAPKNDGSVYGSFNRPVNDKEALALVVSESKSNLSFFAPDGSRSSTAIVQIIPVANGEVSFSPMIIYQYTIFATSTEYTGNLGGIAGADAKCAAHAVLGTKTKTLGGTWKAIISDHSVNAKDRISLIGTLSIQNTNGGNIFNKASFLWSNPASLVNAVGYDENGVYLGRGDAWTGTTHVGLKNQDDCLNWLSSLNSEEGNYGSTTSISNSWMEKPGVGGCDEFARLYCINQ